jgi:phage baseplate assembly protein W
MALTSTRLTRVEVGDSLRTIAKRELGSGLRWVELAELNQLRPPYIVDSIHAADRKRGTLISGDPIRLPVGAIQSAAQTPEDVYGVDVDLSGGDINVANGDYLQIGGGPNLKQALSHRLKTAVGELLAHPDYGCNAHAMLGMKNMPVVVLMVGGYVRRALQAEPRVAFIKEVSPRADGDIVHVFASVQPVSENSPVDLNLAFVVPR